MQIGTAEIGTNKPTYFIADIAANHDGSLKRAIELINLAADSGADAAKFQNFQAETIVSRKGFEDLGAALAHQAKWDSSVFDVYKAASIPNEWTPTLKEACDERGIAYFSAAYNLEAIDYLDPYVPAFKIGSGDINWIESLAKTASKGKPVLIATGASEMQDVIRAMSVLRDANVDVVLMQCNTNYTGKFENLEFVNLNVLKTYSTMYPDVTLGLSDHTHGSISVLGAIALGARVIEKHFTDDPSRKGPDHGFSMSPKSWSRMVQDARELEAALGSAVKRVETNEIESAVVQRRSIRANHDLRAGQILTREMLTVLRPAPPGSLGPDRISELIGKTLSVDISADEPIQLHQLLLG